MYMNLGILKNYVRYTVYIPHEREKKKQTHSNTLSSNPLLEHITQQSLKIVSSSTPLAD